MNLFFFKHGRSVPRDDLESAEEHHDTLLEGGRGRKEEVLGRGARRGGRGEDEERGMRRG